MDGLRDGLVDIVPRPEFARPDEGSSVFVLVRKAGVFPPVIRGDLNSLQRNLLALDEQMSEISFAHVVSQNPGVPDVK